MGPARESRRALAMLTALLGRRPDATLPTGADEWQTVLSLASDHRLLPALWVALRDAGRVVPVPPAVVALIEQRVGTDRTAPELVLEGAYEANVARQHDLLAAGTRALEEIRAAGIPVVAMKGLHTLITDLWADPAARVLADVDVLTRAGDAPRAFEVLVGSGWTPAPEGAGEFADHHLPPLRDDTEVRIDVHDHVVRRLWAEVLPSADVLGAARVIESASGERLVMGDTHAVVTLVAHAQLQDDTYRRLELPLRALHETDRWVEVRGDRIDWEEVVHRFERVGETHALFAHLWLARRLFGTPMPLVSRGRGAVRGRAHETLTRAALCFPRARGAANYLRYLPRSFARVRMVTQYGPPSGPIWVWRARARHVATRVRARVTRR